MLHVRKTQSQSKLYVSKTQKLKAKRAAEKIYNLKPKVLLL